MTPLIIPQVAVAQISWDFNTATLTAIGFHIVMTIVYIVKTNGKATTAHEAAEKATKRAEEAHTSIAAQSAALGLFREHVAREYVSREVMRETKEEITASIDRLSDRLDQVLDKRTR